MHRHLLAAAARMPRPPLERTFDRRDWSFRDTTVEPHPSVPEIWSAAARRVQCGG